MESKNLRGILPILAVAFSVFCITPSHAATFVDWANWADTPVTANTVVNAIGSTSDGLNITFGGYTTGIDYPSWTGAEYSGGNVANPPPEAYGAFQILGGQIAQGTNCNCQIPENYTVRAPLLFARNMVLAVWDQAGDGPTLEFTAPFVVLSGDAQLVGTTTDSGGNTLYIMKGAGIIQMTSGFGATWLSPISGDQYEITAGVVPEVGAWVLMLTGFSATGWMLRTRRKRALAVG